MRDKYAEAKQILNDMASVKMQMNAHKGNIEDLSPSVIMNLLRKEVDELDSSVDTLSEDNIYDRLQEMADVQNFLVALAYQQIEMYRSRK